MSKKTGKIIIDRAEKLKGSRSNWDNHWLDLSNFLVPKKDNVYGYNSKGEKKNNRLYDSTSIHVNELLASALHGLVTNPTIQFFGLTSRDAKTDSMDEVREFTQTVVRKIHQVLSNSNFHNQIHECYIDLGSFGTGLIQVLEDDEDIVRFDSRPIYEGYIQENNMGLIDTVYRRFKWTIKQIIEEFGEDSIDKSLAAKAVTAPMEEFEVIHAVFPKEAGLLDKRLGKANPKNKAYSSYYVLVKDATVLRQSGFDEFPYMVPRWSKISGEIYGRSPGMKALPDIKLLNQAMKTTIRAAQLVIAPPLQGPDDGGRRPVNMRPNGMNFYRAGSGNRIEPIVTGGRIDLGEAFMESIRIRIRQAFFIDQLQLQEGPQMTATEVLQRTEEKVRLLAPILSRLNDELLSPLVERVFGILLRKGEIPQIPSALADKKLEVVFSSTIATAQKSSEADAVTRVIQVAAPFIETQPETMDNFDGDSLVRYLGDVLNAPMELFRTQKAVGQLREARQQQQQQAQAQAQENMDAENINKLG